MREKKGGYAWTSDNTWTRLDREESRSLAKPSVLRTWSQTPTRRRGHVAEVTTMPNSRCK